MRKLLFGVASLVVLLVVVLVVLSVVGLDPKERRPGLWLRGEPVTTPVTDWSFTDRYANILVQTRSWYLLPHSVTVTCTAANGRLYLTSTYREGQRFPDDRLWNRNVLRHPRVRLKIGDRLYDRTLVLVEDPAEREMVLRAKATKYPRLTTPPNGAVHVFRVSAS